MAKKRPPAPPPDPDRFEEAIRAWRRRLPVTEADLADLTAAEAEHAFTVAGVTQANQVQQVFDALDRAIEQGTTLEDFEADVGGALADSWGGADAGRVEMLFRSNLMAAYNEGRQEIFDDPAVKEARPFIRFDAVSDSRACDICDPLDGVVKPADDPFWDKHRPILHPGCRCVLTPLDEEEAHAAGVTHAVPKAEPPAEGFGRGEDYEPDLSGFDPEIAAVLRDRLK